MIPITNDPLVTCGDRLGVSDTVPLSLSSVAYLLGGWEGLGKDRAGQAG